MRKMTDIVFSRTVNTSALNRSIDASSTPLIVSRCARNARSSATMAFDWPGTTIWRYSDSVARSRASSMRCESAISNRINSGISDSSA